MSKRIARKVVIMGAGGRDFHNFNVVFRDDPAYDVVAFTATQIPFIARRVYPPSLAGRLYPKGIPIRPESELADIIRSSRAELVVFAYSDISHDNLMHKASAVLASGADFIMLGPDSTFLRSRKPVISVTAVRTGCGKSPATRKILGILQRMGKRAVAIRHPMAYCDLERQRAERFASMADMDAMSCTIEEREEYEPLVGAGFTVFAGVDYADILKMAEREADVIVWDGGNNDFPFIRPDLDIVVADALRPGHETAYHPGETNLRRADVVLINKAGPGTVEGVRTIRASVKRLNPSARVITAESAVDMEPVSPGAPSTLRGRRVLVIEDGPTLTHGGMDIGAGTVAARQAGARPVAPGPYAVGSIRDVFKKYPHLHHVLPAMGYSSAQRMELEETIRRTPCDAVIFATPVDLARLVKLNKPAYKVTYSIKEKGGLTLSRVVREFIKGMESG
jgi:predicted GTPase